MAILNGYASLTQVKAALRITDSVDDSLLEMAVESASRAIDNYTARNFYKTATDVARVYAATDALLCPIDDLVSLTSIKTSSTDSQSVFDITWATNDYQLEPLNGVVDGRATPYTLIRAVDSYLFQTLNGQASVQVTGVFGYDSIPIDITQATVIQSSRIFKRLDSPLGIISNDLGSMRVGSRLDPDVAQLVDGYRRLRMG